MPELTLFYWLVFSLDHDRAEALASCVRERVRQRACATGLRCDPAHDAG